MLTISDLTYRIGPRLLFDRASAAIPPGAKVGLVGRNGIGKSTLFRLILGEIAAESGTIELPPRARIGHVAQEAPGGPETLIEAVINHHMELSALLREAAAETVTDPERLADIHARLAALDGYSAEARAGIILRGLGFDAEAQKRPCSSYSGGWRMRVALAGALFAAPDILLLDEPTNYLDLEGVLWLESFLKSYPHTVIVISHDRDVLNRAVDSILHLDHGRLTYYTGNYDDFADRLAANRARLEAEARKIEAKRQHMQAFVDRFRAKATKAKQAQSRLKALAKLTPITLDPETETRPIRFPSPGKLSPPLLAMEGGSVGYEPGKPVLRQLDLRIDPDDRIALVGANGNGKSTFAKLLADRLPLMSGRVTKAAKLTVGYFGQHQLDELQPGRTALDHLRDLMPKDKESVVRARLGSFGFGADKADTLVENLSGGEKARLLFALIAFDAPAILILDEPTNHLDIDSRDALIRGIAEYEGAVLLISHDRHLLDACADRLWLVADGRVTPFDGDLDDYEKFVLSSRRPPAKPKAEKPAAPAARAPNLSRDIRSIERKIKALEAEIAKLEEEQDKLATRLADNALYDGSARANAELERLVARDAAVKAALAEKEEGWLALQAELEELTGAA